jgi:hypothetical protein
MQRLSVPKEEIGFNITVIPPRYIIFLEIEDRKYHVEMEEKVCRT